MKILFATMPFDGHFNPLTGLAVHLRQRGHDVRWYTGPTYARKLAALGVPHFPFERATDVNGENLNERFPEASKRVGPKVIAFALEKIFFGNLEAHYKDICALHEGFPFEAIVFDGAFYAGRLVHEKLGIPAYPIYPAPTPAPTSTRMPPPFFGLKPATNVFAKLRERIVNAMVESSTKSGMKILHALRAREGLPPYVGSVFDLHVDTAEAIFQIGAPGMDYPRTHGPKQMQFVGALVPHKKSKGALPAALEAKLEKYESLIAVSQGTIDNRDPDKLFVPSLTALSSPGSKHLVVVTTGGRHSDDLRKRFPQDNVVIEDFIDFDVLLPHADLFICNGGFGSVMRALVNGVPVLAAGKLEGKNDINARLDHCGLALDLETERPTAKQIAAGVDRVLGDARYRERVAAVRAELATYDAFAIIENAIVGRNARVTPFTPLEEPTS
jgi:MGT family glycosyltransferase